LSSIPGLKYLFGSKDHTTSDDELVFLVVPHIVRTQSLDRANLRTVDLGVGQTIELRHVPVQTLGPSPAQSPDTAPGQSLPGLPTRSIPQARSTLGTVPGESAVAAAPAALAQLKESADANSYAANASRQTGPPVPPPSARSTAVNVMLNAPASPVAVGSTFQVQVVLVGGTDIASVATQIQYDPARLSLVNVSGGDLLTRDGQSAAPIHSDPDGKGMLTVNASRPPGAAGVSGPGVVYVLGFQAKSAGQSSLVLSRAGVANSAQQTTPAQGSQVNIVVK
jgi:general secretion pathway protein D